MKNLLLIVLACCMLQSLVAQETCVPNDQRLSTNQLKTSVNPLYLWWDGRNDSDFFYENEYSTPLLFAGGLWVTAQDESRNQRVAITDYGATNGYFDFQSGPIGTGGNFTSSMYFCRSFKVTKDQVSAHLDDLADGTLNQPIPAVMEWPGRNNAMMPATAFDLDLAPFVDVNEDGIYQPELGEVPDFHADEAIWWVTNDYVEHLESGSFLPLSVDVQVLAQAYKGPGHPAEKAQVYSVKLINRSDISLDSLSVSLWVDPWAITCELPPEFGTIPSRNTVFSYQPVSENPDSVSLSTCRPSYLESSPIVFFKILSSSLNGEAAIVRNSGINYRLYGDGSRPNIHFYERSHGRWDDQSPLTVGGSGYGGTQPTNWAFFGNPADNSSWSTCQNDSLIDPRFVLNANLHEKFNPGDEFETNYSVFVVDGEPVACQDIDALIPTLDSITDYVQNTVVSSNRTPRAVIEALSLKPNPARDVFEISLGVGQEALHSATLFDGLGRVVEQYSPNELNGTINVAHLPRGTYSIVARDTKGEMYRSRVVLQ